MRTLIVGLGSIGLRHLKNLRAIVPGAHITLWRQRSTHADIDPALADNVVYSLEDALADKPEIAIISNPSTLHIQTALVLAEHDINLFIEKPLSNNLDNVDRLLNLCREKNLILMTGYNMRFNHSMQMLRKLVSEKKIGRIMSVRAEVGQYLPKWRANTDYRTTVSARSDLGGGAVLELSHELDYLYWLFGEVKNLSALTGKLSDLEIDVEDTAEIIMQFKNGIIGSLHLDMTQVSATRTCRLTGTEGALLWDGLTNKIQYFSTEENSWSEIYSDPLTDRNDMYIDEMRHFLECVKAKKQPQITGHEGLYVLKLALAIKESSENGRAIEII